MAWQIESDLLVGDMEHCIAELEQRYVKDSVLTLSFRGDIISVGWHNKKDRIMPGLFIVFPAIHDPTESSSCLELVYNDYYNSVNQIYAGKAVPAHIEKKGTWLVELALTISRALNIKKLQLEDIAELKGCKYMSLKLLRTFEGKRACWYRNFGFRPKVDTLNQEQLLYNFPLLQLTKYIPDPKDFTTLGPYMSYLAHSDKKRYHHTLRLLGESIECGTLILEIISLNVAVVCKL